jgi:glycosyltransferase involved in cell wall biosynthesis
VRILIAHNAYQQRGGEDVVFDQESEMLEEAGYAVGRFSVNNDHIHGLAAKLGAARSAILNKASIASLGAEIAAFAPDLVHIHNFFPTLSAGALEAVADQGLPIVFTVHNFRLICAGALLLRDGRPCEDCVGRRKLAGVVHACYRQSRFGTAVVAAVGAYVKRFLRKNPLSVTIIALTHFSKSRLVSDGFPEDRIVVRGNVIPDPGVGPDNRERRIVYVGRLSFEKGVDTLLNAARGLSGIVEIIGDGPERQKLESMAPANVVFRGSLTHLQVLERIKSAAGVAVPSRWYEMFPLVCLEAMATGTPLLVSHIGGLPEIVADRQTGLLLPPDSHIEWKDAMRELLESASYARAIGLNARSRYLDRHSVKRGVADLVQIYRRACDDIKRQ